MVLGASGHQRPHFDGFIYIRYGAPPYLARISAIYPFHLAEFGWVPFADLCAQRLAIKENVEFTEGARKLRSYILTRLWTKVHEIIEQCRRPLVLPNSFARLSMSRFVFTIKSRSRRKTEQM